MQDFVLKIHTNSGGRDPRTSAAEGETFVRTHRSAHLPDAGAPPLLIGWLRRWFSPFQCFPLWCCALMCTEIAEAQCKIFGLCVEFVPQFKIHVGD